MEEEEEEEKCPERKKNLFFRVQANGTTVEL